MAVALTATIDAARLAVLLTLTGVPAGADTFKITRHAASGGTADVRGASGAVVAIPTQTIRDFEVPLDVAVTYTATVLDGVTVVGTATATLTVAWGSCEAWLCDLARPTNSLPLVIESLQELAYETPAGVHRVLGRRTPVLTSLPAWTPSGELIVLTDTLAERDDVRAALGTGYPILLRTTPDMGIGNAYFGVTGFVEERFLAPGRSPERRFRASVVQVDRPDPAVYVPVPPNTYANVKATYATYTALKAGVASYDALAYTFPAGPDASPVPPWPPTDV